jgi:hypothetical protein
VRVKLDFVPGHIRLPGYIRGKVGTVVGESPAYPFPDAHAHGIHAEDEPTYDVRFHAEDLWPNGCDPAWSMWAFSRATSSAPTEPRCTTAERERREGHLHPMGQHNPQEVNNEHEAVPRGPRGRSPLSPSRRPPTTPRSPTSS